MKFFTIRSLRDLCLTCGVLLLASCATTPDAPEGWTEQYVAFRQTEGWKKQVFLNPAIYDQITKSRSSVIVSLADQRGYLLLDDEHVAMDFPVATGSKNYRTPTGSYKIIEMKETYASNLYGRFVDIESGKTIDSDADSRKPTPAGAKFVGASMPNWMRLTNTGVGLHIGHVPGYPVSHGCVRVVRSAMARLYPVCELGTPVEIHETWTPNGIKVLGAQNRS